MTSVLQTIHINALILGNMQKHHAERQGFEPWVRLRRQRFSRPPHSTALASLRLTVCKNKNNNAIIAALFHSCCFRKLNA